jgi:hypothetical protein
MEKIAIKECLSRAASDLALTLEGSPSYGWHFKSAGSKVSNVHGKTWWLRVLRLPKSQKNETIWTGLKNSAKLEGVKKPSWYSDHEWDEIEFCCRADVLEFIKDKPISDKLELSSEIELPEVWLSQLRLSLENLHRVTTTRVCVRQDLVTRRLQSRFGTTVDATITEWETSHGDLHWANVTTPNCWLLDWEAWGSAPKGFDVALLYCSALTQPRTAASVYEYFRDWLETPNGKKSQMFACAELMRMTEVHSDHPGLYSLLMQRGQKLASSG